MNKSKRNGSVILCVDHAHIILLRYILLSSLPKLWNFYFFMQTLRARVAAKAEEKKLELLFLQWSDHHKTLCNYLRYATCCLNFKMHHDSYSLETSITWSLMSLLPSASLCNPAVHSSKLFCFNALVVIDIHLVWECIHHTIDMLSC